MRPLLGRGLAVCLVFWFGATALLTAQKPQLRVGLVIDGDSSQVDQTFLPLLKKEIEQLLGRDYEVQFPQAKERCCDWSLDKIRDHFDELVNDDEVDVVVCLGVLASLYACNNGPYDKPVFAPWVIDRRLPGIPFEEGASGVTNLNYLVTSVGLEQDALSIQRLAPVKKLHFVADELFGQVVPGLLQYVADSFGKHGMEAVLVPTSTSSEEVLAQIPPTAEFVYVAPLFRFSQEEKQALYAGLKKRRLPSFALLGEEEVQMGAMAGTSSGSDFLRFYRRIALNIQRALSGEDPGTFPVLVEEGTKLKLNMAVARAVGWYPSWELQNSADLINEEPEITGREFSLRDVVLRAVDRNLEIQAKMAELAAAEAFYEGLRANRRPQISSEVTQLHIDEDTSAASFGAQSERSTTGRISVEQLLYSDSVNAGIEAQRHVLEAQRQELASLRLDIAGEAATRFLNYLKARTLYRIEKDNVGQSLSHLETAQSRRRIGMGNPSEVYRWESQVASDKQRAISAQNQAKSALYALNQVLNEVNQEELLVALEPDLTDESLMTGEGRLAPYVANAFVFEKFRGFMVMVGLEQSPELKRLDLLIKAQKRQVLANKRVYYRPTVAFQGGYNYVFDRKEGAGLDLPGVTLPNAPDAGWSAALNLSLPLYQGGARSANLKQSVMETKQLELSRDLVAQQVELSIRASLRNVGAASAAIDLSRVAAEAARQNMVLVDDSYRKGLASAIDVLDAQSAARVADQAAANAVYDFLIELFTFQRAAANFDFFIDAAERETFFQRLNQFYDNPR
ncbi:TolC family protein [Acanthopleuribacter pedis]|uniref:TolC family protein n=1 Tax=Acanthopleuribacter pedis TaxID=442870 RepID=A0A8J7U0T9_9BACT|nr:TolC family protein [Acanthopleuribacter pedis]MBO1316862.1 TolC family protein [Acanthopleuribacter pedis]